MKNVTSNKFVWADEEIDEEEEVKSNEVIRNESSDAAVAMELMEDTMKKNLKLSKKLNEERIKMKLKNSLLIVSCFLNLFLCKVVCIEKTFIVLFIVCVSMVILSFD